jgi:hypothetical protein
MNCCEKCLIAWKGELAMGTDCSNPNCQCHSKPLEWGKELRKEFSEWLITISAGNWAISDRGWDLVFDWWLDKIASQQKENQERIREIIKMFDKYFAKHQNCKGVRLACRPEDDIEDMYEKILKYLK